jgi:hypothetical protein
MSIMFAVKNHLVNDEIPEVEIEKIAQDTAF